MKPTLGLRSFLLGSLFFTATPLLHATPYYWDTDDTTAGFGNTAGTWGTDAFWSTVVAGTGSTANTTITSSDGVNFGTSTLALTSPATTIGIEAAGVTTNSITFGSAQATAVTLSSGGGNITLAGTMPTITVNNTTDTIGASLKGTDGMIKVGNGTLVLTGASNTYTGSTTINGGTLDASGGRIYNGVGASEVVTVNSGGILVVLNMAAGGVGSLSANAANFVVDGGTIRQTAVIESSRGRAITVGANGATLEVDGTGYVMGYVLATPNVYTDNSTFTLSGSGSATITKKIEGTGVSLVKGGTGTWTITPDAAVTSNNFTGTTTVNGGILSLGNINAIANTSSVSVVSGATLQVSGAGTYANTSAVSLVGTGSSATVGALHFTNNAASVWNAPLTLGGAATTISSFANTASPTLGAAIGGTGPLTISSRGGNGTTDTATWTLGVASNYVGNTNIFNNAGLKDITVKLGATNALPTTTSLNLSANTNTASGSNVFATLDLNGFSQTLAGLTDTGGTVVNADNTSNKRVINSSGTLATLTINNAGAVTYGTVGTGAANTSTAPERILAGTIGGTTAAGVAADNIALTKTGAGTLTLNGINTYTGATVVSDGKLVINGSISTSSLTTVDVGATLAGSGTVGKAIINGTLAVGNSPGQMDFIDTLGLAGSTIMEIDGTSGAGVTGGHDFVNLTGVGAAGILTYGGTMTLDLGMIFGAGSYSWNLFDMASETGTFTTITLADQYSGSLLDGDLNGIWDLTSGSNTWQFTESTGVLGLTVIPEPGAALLGSLGLLALLRRRRN